MSRPGRESRGRALGNRAHAYIFLSSPKPLKISAHMSQLNIKECKSIQPDRMKEDNNRLINNILGKGEADMLYSPE